MVPIGKTLHSLRVQAGLTQKEVAQRLSQGLKPITHQAVSKWETGDAKPDVLQFLSLCGLYGVRDVQAVFCPEENVGALNTEGLRKLREYEELLRLSGLYCLPVKECEESVPPRRTLRLFDLPASAGTGQLLDSDRYIEVEADATVPACADFAVRIAGDSMLPRFTDGQVVWVQGQPAVESGEIGLFFYDGEAFCKRLEADENGVRLVSLNKKYPPIPIVHTGELRVFGKVVG